MLRHLQLILIVSIIFVPVSASALSNFSDDFESGLSNWTIGGRQLEGTNIADTVQRNGSTVGHLFKFSFTEITLERTFDFDATEVFNFEMEVAVSSTTPPAPEFYGQSGVRIFFLDSAGETLGGVEYGAATTNFIFDLFDSDPTRQVNEVAAGIFASYSLSTMELLSQITIDESEIVETLIQFRTYSSTRPNPSVTAELWVDNFNAVPEPSTVIFLGIGLAVMSAAPSRAAKRR